MTRRQPSLAFADRPPMLARRLDPGAQAFAPAFAHLRSLERETAALKWLFDNDPEKRT